MCRDAAAAAADFKLKGTLGLRREIKENKENSGLYIDAESASRAANRKVSSTYGPPGNQEKANSFEISERDSAQASKDNEGSDAEQPGEVDAEQPGEVEEDGAREDEDLDGYSDVGWGDRKPVSGEDLASLVMDPQDLEVVAHLVLNFTRNAMRNIELFLTPVEICEI